VGIEDGPELADVSDEAAQIDAGETDQPDEGHQADGTAQPDETDQAHETDQADEQADEPGDEAPADEAPADARYESLWVKKEEPLQVPDLASLDPHLEERDE
jgi:hypothetical protein